MATKSLSKKTRLGKSYVRNYPDVWDKAADATTCLIALQALILKPQDQVDVDQIEELVDATIANLIAIKDILDRQLLATK